MFFERKFFYTAMTLILVLNLFPATYYVDSVHGSDGYPGTSMGPWEHISYAISQAAAGDTLMLSGTFYLGQDPGVTANGIEITKGLTFIGEGAKNTFVKAHLNPGTAAYRVFKVNIGSAVTMMNMSIENGVSAGNGGAIVNWHVLNLIDVNISNNECADFGGAIFNYGNMTFNRVTMHNNTAGEYGGALYSQGLYASAQNITMINTTVSGNTVTNNSGGGIFLFAAANSRNVTISLTMNSCTVADNTTGSSTGDGLNCATAEPSTYTALVDLDIRNSVFDNSSNYNENTANGGSINLARTYTFSSDETLPTTNSYYNSVDPLLQPLSDNGGQTMTHATVFGSKLINAIPEGGTAYNGAPLTDQRGVGISRGSNKDVGAYEFNSPVTFYLNSGTGDDDTGDGSQSSPWANLSKALGYYYEGDIVDMTGTFYMSDDPNVNVAVANGYVLGQTSDKNYIIRGQGADQTFLKACPDGQTAESRLFLILEDSSLELYDISLQNGYDGAGGAIQARGDLTLERVMINNCSTPDFQNGGAIYFEGDLLNISNSTIYSNYSSNFGGAMYLAVMNKEITVNLTNSTFAQNAAENGGGVIYASVYTISEAYSSTLNLNINAITSGYNEDHSHQGSFIVYDTSGFNCDYNVSLQNSVINDIGNNESGVVVIDRNCTVCNDETIGILGQYNQNVDDCLLGELSDNGGGILTFPLMEGSPAIDAIPIGAGTSDYNGAPLLDQRGVAIINGNKDMGAYEGSIPYYLTAPADIDIYYDGIVWLSWYPVERATGYAVYSSPDPYGTFSLEGTTESQKTNWDKDFGLNEKYFFYVITLDSTRTAKKAQETIFLKKP